MDVGVVPGRLYFNRECGFEKLVFFLVILNLGEISTLKEDQLSRGFRAVVERCSHLMYRHIVIASAPFYILRHCNHIVICEFLSLYEIIVVVSLDFISVHPL